MCLGGVFLWFEYRTVESASQNVYVKAVAIREKCSSDAKRRCVLCSEDENIPNASVVCIYAFQLMLTRVVTSNGWPA